MVNERVGRITNEDIYNLCQQILGTVKDYGEQTIKLLNQINAKLDTIYEGIKTLSDNQVVLDEKLESLRSLTDEIRGIVRELRAVLPGV